MMQIKGKEKSANYDRYKKAMGAGGLGMMPSEKAALEAARLAAMPTIDDLPNIQGKTDTREKDCEEPVDDVNDPTLEEEDNEEDFMAALRAKRIAEMKAAQAKTQKYKNAGQGHYNEIKEDEFLPTLNGSRHCVVHFYHKDYERCLIIHKHLDIIAKRHLETKIVRLNVEKAPFFTSKLSIKTLPTVVTFLEGVSKSRLVGFEDLGGCDSFSTEALETWLRKRGMLKKTEEQEQDEEETAEEERNRRLNPIRGHELEEIF
jgi:hypothetical protein